MEKTRDARIRDIALQALITCDDLNDQARRLVQYGEKDITEMPDLGQLPMTAGAVATGTGEGSLTDLAGMLRGMHDSTMAYAPKDMTIRQIARNFSDLSLELDMILAATA